MAISLTIVGLQVLITAGLGWFLLTALVRLPRWGMRGLRWLTLFGLAALALNLLLHLFPEILKLLGWQTALPYVVAGFGVAWGLQGGLDAWLKQRFSSNQAASQASRIANLQLGDAACNFLDGAIIASAALVDPILGVTTALVVSLHELPQETGEMSLLMGHGLNPTQAVLTNLATSGAAALIGAGMVVALGAAFISSTGIISALGVGVLLHYCASWGYSWLKARPQSCVHCTSAVASK